MDTRKIILTSFALVVVTMGYFFFNHDSGKQVSADGVGQPVLSPSVDLNGIDAITLSTSSGKTSLVKDGEGFWGIRELDGFPADASKIYRLLEDLREIKVAAFVGRGRNFFSEFGLDETDENWKGQNLKLTAQGEEILDLKVGDIRVSPNASSSTGGLYVSLGDSETIHLLQSEYGWEDERLDWARKKMLNLAAGEVDSVAIAKDGEGFRLEKDGTDDAFSLAGKAVASTAVDDLFGRLEPLEIVAPVLLAEVEEASLEPKGSVDLDLGSNGSILLEFYQTSQNVESKGDDDLLLQLTLRSPRDEALKKLLPATEKNLFVYSELDYGRFPFEEAGFLE